MNKEQKGGCGDPECGCGGEQCGDELDEIEVVELEDKNGDTEEFAILDQLAFEGRHSVIMAPYAEAQKLRDIDLDDPRREEIDLSIAIFECDGDDYLEVEDEDLAQRLIARLDELADELEGQEQEG
jgi:hypothetical protein